MADVNEQARASIQAILDARCEREGKTKATLVRYVVITEEMGDGESRRVGWFSRSFDGTGLYLWETLGLMKYALTDLCNEVTSPVDDDG
jgi:hypothetical protein